jgi:hypothetical protein
MRYRLVRVLMMLAAGGLVLQTAGCDLFATVETALLAILTGTTIFMAMNI